MALNDLTGQNIQDTYQKVVQTEGGNLADGTGSLFPIKFDGPDLIVSGALKAQSYIISQSILNISSGSTAFGDTSDDSHTFLGSITASGNISASGTITTSGATIKGHLTGKNSGLNDSHLTAFTNIQGYGNFTMGNSTTIDSHIITGRSEFVGNITASNNISAGGTIIATNGFGTIDGGTW